jgi:hypothetical protein
LKHIQQQPNPWWRGRNLEKEEREEREIEIERERERERFGQPNLLLHGVMKLIGSVEVKRKKLCI